MNLFLGAIAEGLILVPLTLGLFLSYRIFRILDLTTDGSFGIGAALAAALLVRGFHPVVATTLATIAGIMSGSLTGLLTTGLRINPSLAGILVSTSLYSVALFVMGGGNLSLVSVEGLGTRGTIILIGLLVLVLARCLTAFLRTDLGLAMRATGDNPAMARSVAVDVDRMLVLGLSLANGLVALSGALLAQYQGYASSQSGIGAIVLGLATMLLGEAILGRRPLGRWISAAVAGALLFRLIIAGAIYAGLDAGALKLVTALFVLLALLLPKGIRRFARTGLRTPEYG